MTWFMWLEYKGKCETEKRAMGWIRKTYKVMTEMIASTRKKKVKWKKEIRRERDNSVVIDHDMCSQGHEYYKWRDCERPSYRKMSNGVEWVLENDWYDKNKHGRTEYVLKMRKRLCRSNVFWRIQR